METWEGNLEARASRILLGPWEEAEVLIHIPSWPCAACPLASIHLIGPNFAPAPAQRPSLHQLSPTKY